MNAEAVSPPLSGICAQDFFPWEIGARLAARGRRIIFFCHGLLGIRIYGMNTNERLAGRSILIVDDDKDTREMLRFILEQDGALVMSAGSVPEAVEHYKKSPPDAMIADIGMPEFNGYALIALIRDHDKELGRST